MSTLSENAASGIETRPTWRPVVRLLASLLLFFHVTALVVGPAAVPPSSLLLQRIWEFYRPYLEAAYLNHGYQFFAPAPGPSHLVRYVVEMPDGSRREGIFPNLKKEQPRLLYHRYFMLSERLGSVPPDAQVPWIESYKRSYAEHLLDQYGGVRVTLYLRRHLLPFPEQVLEGMKLDDPRLYEERLLGVYPGEEL